MPSCIEDPFSHIFRVWKTRENTCHFLFFRLSGIIRDFVNVSLKLPVIAAGYFISLNARLMQG